MSTLFLFPANKLDNPSLVPGSLLQVIFLVSMDTVYSHGQEWVGLHQRQPDRFFFSFVCELMSSVRERTSCYCSQRQMQINSLRSHRLPDPQDRRLLRDDVKLKQMKCHVQ